jgi:hypothetical protein
MPKLSFAAAAVLLVWSGLSARLAAAQHLSAYNNESMFCEAQEELPSVWFLVTIGTSIEVVYRDGYLSRQCEASAYTADADNLPLMHASNMQSPCNEESVLFARNFSSQQMS